MNARILYHTIRQSRATIHYLNLWLCLAEREGLKIVADNGAENSDTGETSLVDAEHDSE